VGVVHESSWVLPAYSEQAVISGAFLGLLLFSGISFDDITAGRERVRQIQQSSQGSVFQGEWPEGDIGEICRSKPKGTESHLFQQYTDMVCSEEVGMV